MKKRLREGCMALFMISMCIAPIYAQDEETDGTTINKGGTSQSADTNLKYKVSSDYVVIIPQNLTITNEHTETLQFTSTKMNTEVNASVVVKITGLNQQKASLKRTGDESYQIGIPVLMNGEPVSEDQTIARFMGTDINPVENTGILNFGEPIAVDGKQPIKAGDYTGTLTFTVSYGQDATTGGGI